MATRQEDIISLNGFNVQAVLDHFGIQHEDKVLCAAVQSFYNYEAGGMRFDAKSVTGHRTAAVEQTILALEYPIDNLRRFAPDFFQNAEYDRDAVIVAAICGDKLDPDGEDYHESFFRNLASIDATLQERATIIALEACSYINCAEPETPATSEGAFVAHSETLCVIKSVLQDYSNGQDDIVALYALQSECLSAVPAFIQERPAISLEILENIKEVYQHIWNAHAPQPEPPHSPQPPHLHLVKS